MKYTTGDELEDSAKQHSLDYVFKNLADMVLYGTDGDRVVEDLEDITADDIDNYMDYLSTSKELAIKDGMIMFARVNSIDLYYDICENMEVSQENIPLIGQQKIYFVHTNDFVSTVIPLQTGKSSTRILIEPFEDSSMQIQALKWELEGRNKTKKSFVELKESFDYRSKKK